MTYAEIKAVFAVLKDIYKWEISSYCYMETYGEVQRLSMVKYMVRDRAILKCEESILDGIDIV